MLKRLVAKINQVIPEIHYWPKMRMGNANSENCECKTICQIKDKLFIPILFTTNSQSKKL
jgi:hypothetical protein